MKRNHTNTIVSAVGAALSLALLAGCSGVPAEVTNALGGMGEALSGMGQAIGGAVDGLLDETSVAEAREQRRADLTPALADADLKTPGTLTVGLQATGTAPLVIAGDDGGYRGIDVDTAYALADQLGLGSVEFVPVQSVAEGVETCDVVMGAEADETGCTVVGSYAQSALGVFSATEVAAVPVTAADLAGATIGVQAGSVSQVALVGLDLGAVEQDFINLNEAFEALSAGTVNYVICDAYAGAYLATSYTGVSFAGTIDTPMTVGIAVAPDAAELLGSVQAALDEIQTNGVAAIGKSRWVGDFPALTEATVVTGLPDPQEEAEKDEEADNEGADADDEGADDSEDGTLIGTAVGVDDTEDPEEPDALLAP